MVEVVIVELPGHAVHRLVRVRGSAREHVLGRRVLKRAVRPLHRGRGRELPYLGPGRSRGHHGKKGKSQRSTAEKTNSVHVTPESV